MTKWSVIILILFLLSNKCSKTDNNPCNISGEKCSDNSDCCSPLICDYSRQCNCKTEGLICTSNNECCTGSCFSGGCRACQNIKLPCTVSGDCCGTLQCINSKCEYCKNTNEACSNSSECCSLNCDSGNCGCPMDHAPCAANATCCPGHWCGRDDYCGSGHGIGSPCQQDTDCYCQNCSALGCKNGLCERIGP